MKYFYYIIPYRTAICLLSRGGSCRVIGSWSLLLSFTLHSCSYPNRLVGGGLTFKLKILDSHLPQWHLSTRGGSSTAAVFLWPYFHCCWMLTLQERCFHFHTVIKSVLCLSPQMNVWGTWPLWPVMQRTWSEFCPRWRRLSGPRGPTHPLRGLASLPSLLIHRSSSANGQHWIYNWK